jgi:hypothetical protein
MTLKTTLAEKFRQYLPNQTDSGQCIMWNGFVNGRGYGQLSTGKYGTRIATHVAWFLKYETWPVKLMLHTCGNRRCVNVQHLYEGNDKDNSRDAVEAGSHYEARKIRCARGHLFSGYNLITIVTPSGTRRRCRVCSNESWNKAAKVRRASKGKT